MSSHQYVYVMHRLSKAWPGGKEVLKNISLSFLPGAKIGVLGLNGAGKSTLLKIMAGLDTEFNGEAWAADGIKVGYLAQEPELDASMDVAGNVLSGLGEAKELMDRFNEVSARFAEELTDDEMNEVIAEQAELQEKIDAIDGWDLERKAEIAWLQRFLHDFPGTVVTITHDRYFLDEVAGWILELDRGAGIPYEGNYSGWLEQKQKRLEQEGKAEDARVKSLSRELDWVRAAPKARQAKSKARISAYEKMLAEDNNRQVDTAKIHIPAGPRLGDIVINAEGLSKGFGERLLIDDLSFRLPPGGIVGVIGPNGAGKTTLFRMITGGEAPDAGTFTVGETVKLGYVDQSRDDLEDDKTVWEVISDGLDEIELGKRTMASRAYVGQFNFKGGDQQKRVSQLSGGERNRVHLARMLKSGANLLLLDEPTNDLDVDTLRALEEALEEFAGCAVVVSHDRWFLDRIATHILAFEGDSHVEWFEGNYEAYEADRKRRLGAEADRPTRIKYKPISR